MIRDRCLCNEMIKTVMIYVSYADNTIVQTYKIENDNLIEAQRERKRDRSPSPIVDPFV